MNEDRILKRILYVKVKEKFPRGRLRSREEQQVRKYVTQRERRNLGREVMGRKRKTHRPGCHRPH
jgi:hypothetical protein